MALTGALALSKIATTYGSDFFACLLPPFQRKWKKEKLLRKQEPRTVHTIVLHNTVAGKKTALQYVSLKTMSWIMQMYCC